MLETGAIGFALGHGPDASDEVLEFDDSLVLLMDNPAELFNAFDEPCDAVLAVGLALEDVELGWHAL